VKLIVGLGNPGRQYAETRHNVGWWALDHLADVWRLGGWRRDGDAVATDGRLGEHRVRLLKPQTFMNLSGAALRPYLRRPTFSPATDLLVIVDEAALPLAILRLRAHGSAGGHNGLKSIEAAVQSQEYARLRIGIKPDGDRQTMGDLSDFVLDRFGKAEKEAVLEVMPRVTQLCETWLSEGAAKASLLNTPRKKSDSADDDSSGGPPGAGAA
jgi:PTH1 family peptidyl-tRNA hydrolase